MTLKIEAGKFYRTRDGRKVGPMRVWVSEDGTFDDGSDDGEYWGSDGLHAEGIKIYDHKPDRDLIAEWTDEPARKHFTDLTAIDCPFGELDDDTQSRLDTSSRPGCG